MDTPTTAALWIIGMAVLAFGASLGGVTWVYFADKRRSSTPRRAADQPTLTGLPTAHDEDREPERQAA